LGISFTGNLITAPFLSSISNACSCVRYHGAGARLHFFRTLPGAGRANEIGPQLLIHPFRHQA
jgi:hypothetical protein